MIVIKVAAFLKLLTFLLRMKGNNCIIVHNGLFRTTISFSNLNGCFKTYCITWLDNFKYGDVKLLP